MNNELFKDTSNVALHNDAIDMLCGRFIGEGSTRKVFECTLMPGYVIKVEKDSSSFRNIEEFKIWSSVMNTEHEKWFAKIHLMSSSGRFLIMEKTVPPGPNDWPEKLPPYISDRHRGNFGMVADEKGKYRFVCHDYGHNQMLEIGPVKRLTKVDWNEDSK